MAYYLTQIRTSIINGSPILRKAETVDELEEKLQEIVDNITDTLSPDTISFHYIEVKQSDITELAKMYKAHIK